MRNKMMNIPYVHKPFCTNPKYKDEAELFDAISLTKEYGMIVDLYSDLLGKEIKEKHNLLISSKMPSEKQMESFLHLFNNESNQKKFDLFAFSNDLITANRVSDRVKLFCYTNDFPLPYFLLYWAAFREDTLNAMLNLEEYKGMDIKLMVAKVVGYANDGITSITTHIPVEGNGTLYSIISHNYHMAEISVPEFTFNQFTQNSQRMIIENTFNSAIDSLEDSFTKLDTHKRIMGINYRKSDTSLVEQLKTDKDVFVKAFTNNRSYARIQKDNHYLRALKNPIVNFADNLKATVIAEDLERGLIIGYTSKHLSLLIGDKRTVIAELERNLDVLKKYGDPDDAKIKFTEMLISFTKQTRYADYYPYKAIAKFTGMKKSEVKNLCKKIFGHDRNKAIDSSFDNLTLIEP